MPGQLGDEHYRNRIENPGIYDLEIVAANQRPDDDYVLVIWATDEGSEFRERVGIEGQFAWQLGRMLKAIGLPHNKGEAWNERDWIGQRAQIELRENKKGYLYSARFITDAPAVRPPEEDQEQSPDDDIPF